MAIAQKFIIAEAVESRVTQAIPGMIAGVLAEVRRQFPEADEDQLVRAAVRGMAAAIGHTSFSGLKAKIQEACA